MHKVRSFPFWPSVYSSTCAKSPTWIHAQSHRNSSSLPQLPALRTTLIHSRCARVTVRTPRLAMPVALLNCGVWINTVCIVDSHRVQSTDVSWRSCPVSHCIRLREELHQCPLQPFHYLRASSSVSAKRQRLNYDSRDFTTICIYIPPPKIGSLRWFRFVVELERLKERNTDAWMLPHSRLGSYSGRHSHPSAEYHDPPVSWEATAERRNSKNAIAD